MDNINIKDNESHIACKKIKIELKSNIGNTFTKPVESLGSSTAKGGFEEEKYIAQLICENLDFNHALRIYFNLSDNEIAHISKGKCDYMMFGANVQHKKTKSGQSQQLDRHWVRDLINHVPNLKPIEPMLKNLCEKKGHDKTRKLDHYLPSERDHLLKMLEENKKSVLEYIFLGIDPDTRPDILSYSIFEAKIRKLIVFIRMEHVLEHYMKGTLSIRASETVTDFGNGLTFQRKGGDAGKESANQYQFKIVPTKLSVIPHKYIHKC